MSDDPRFHLAAQRTLLAWLRTGLAVMAFGFVLSRVGILVGLLSGGRPATPPGRAPVWLGLALIALGVVATGAGALQYQRLCRSLAQAHRPTPGLANATIAIAWAVALAGVLLGVLVAATSPGVGR